MASPNDRKYAQTHEWHKVEDDVVVIGVSQFAVDELTDITYVDIAVREGDIAQGEAFGEIESVKATSELYSGVDGEVVAVNEAVLEKPALVNESPFDTAWLIKVKPSDPGQLESLMDADSYDAQHK